MNNGPLITSQNQLHYPRCCWLHFPQIHQPLCQMFVCLLLSSCCLFPSSLLISKLQPYKTCTTTWGNSDDDTDDDDDDELDHYLWLKVALNSTCPNPIQWWLDHTAVFPNLGQMALNYIIIPGVYHSLVSMTCTNQTALSDYLDC